MRITRVQIKNFRSIEDATVLLHDLTAVVGPNNAGKSNIPLAIAMLFDGPETASPDDFAGFASRRRNIDLECDVLLAPSERAVITRRLHRTSAEKYTLQVRYAPYQWNAERIVAWERARQHGGEVRP